MKKFWFVLLILLNALLSSGQGKLYLLQIIQPSASTTGAIKDGEIIISIAKEICTASGHTFNLISIQSANASMSFIQTKLNEFSFTKDDVIWFYYSGHGENYDTWPRTDETELSQTDVFNLLSSTNAGLTLSMFDCCCWRKPIAPPPITIEKKLYTTCNPAVYKYLFRYSKGHIKIASCSSEEFSYGSESSGSFYTNSFIDALKTDFSKKNLDLNWYNVLKIAKENTQTIASKFSKTQNPQYYFSNGFKDVGN